MYVINISITLVDIYSCYIFCYPLARCERESREGLASSSILWTEHSSSVYTYSERLRTVTSGVFRQLSFLSFFLLKHSAHPQAGKPLELKI